MVLEVVKFLLVFCQDDRTYHGFEQSANQRHYRNPILSIHHLKYPSVSLGGKGTLSLHCTKVCIVSLYREQPLRQPEHCLAFL
jgi:hypothetical protein